MKGSRPTNRELQDALNSATDKIATLQSKLETALDSIGRLERTVEYYPRMLSYYQNPDTPPSADSLEWKRQKRQSAERRKNDGETGKRPGGRKGHSGASRSHEPDKKQHHSFGRMQSGNRKVPVPPMCGCSSKTVIGTLRVRDIIDLEITARDTRHRIDTAVCCMCGNTQEAPNDLPQNGSYGRRLVGFVAELRAARVPLVGISRVVESVAGIKTAVVTRIDMRSSWLF